MWTSIYYVRGCFRLEDAWAEQLSKQPHLDFLEDDAYKGGQPASQSALDGPLIGKKGLMHTLFRAHEILLGEGKRREGGGGEGGIEQRIYLYARPSVILRSLPHGRRKAVPRALLP